MCPAYDRSMQEKLQIKALWFYEGSREAPGIFDVRNSSEGSREAPVICRSSHIL